MLKEVTSVTVTPTAASASDVTVTVRLGQSGTPETVASGAASSAITITPKADLSVPHEIYVTVTAKNDGTNTKTYKIRVYHVEALSFGSATVSDKRFTAGTEVPSDAALALPAVTDAARLDVSYTATGLPAGLSLSRNRVITGTPGTATTAPVTVTYTATASEVGSSASLTFQVTVAAASPPLTFNAAAIRNFTNQNLAYTVGQASPLTFSFPPASGGTGNLTYYLSVKDPRTPISSYISGFAFDSSSRVLTVGANGVEPDPDTCTHGTTNSTPRYCVYPLRYWVEDENGTTATATSNIHVSNAPSLAEIGDQRFTVGDAVSISLPRSPSGAPIVSQLHPFDYRLEPGLEDLSLDHQSLALTGTARYTGSTEMTWTVTDRNGVSASRTFTLNVVSGQNAPASSPTLTVSVEGGASVAKLEWGDLAGVTRYVTQVRAADESFPSQAIAYHIGRTGNYGYQTRTGDTGRIAYVHVAGLTAGSYTARAAGLNDDGAGPWSNEVNFTVTVGGL